MDVQYFKESQDKNVGQICFMYRMQVYGQVQVNGTSISKRQKTDAIADLESNNAA